MLAGEATRDGCGVASTSSDKLSDEGPMVGSLHEKGVSTGEASKDGCGVASTSSDKL